MAMCPKMDNCKKLKMILDKDLTFDWLYSAQIKKVCEICNQGIKNANNGSHNKKKVILTYV